ncbi:hypothetical protein BDP27DRAFT_1323009 [Rhodocollybia butyracea]|uniref:Secreted protein n=1 Tax=Rhodocollybia butyracea TaxID=206335 RepID=A0A9P5PWP4_9AGAR|nr:hypothetical protein BDP27DRAFT_1335293 [Rhodocollybia butyracea]KAF9070781.1 hypothetical protein BDP27DRAFT_1323009 [Rhodocollybia butyracea]
MLSNLKFSLLLPHKLLGLYSLIFKAFKCVSSSSRPQVQCSTFVKCSSSSTRNQRFDVEGLLRCIQGIQGGCGRK